SIRQKEHPGDSWQDANRDYLSAEMSRLRLVLQLRVLWLRKLWKRNPLQGFREWVVSDAEADRLLAASQQESPSAFYESDEEAARLCREILDQRAVALDAAERANSSGSPPAMEILAKLFHLSDFDREVLLLSLAPELDPAFERLFAYVQDDATRKFPTAHL